MHKKTALCSFVFCFLSSTALASIATHFSEASFAASSGPTLLESFEGLTPIPTGAYPGSATSYVLTDFNLAISGTGLTMGVYDMPNAGTYATKGTNFIGTGNQNPYTLIFTFTKPILSFGLAITDFADIIPSTISVQVQSGASTTVLTGPSTATKLADGNLLFFGLTTTDMPMTEIRLISNSSDPIGIDAVQYSFAPVPEAGGLIIWSVLGLCVGIKAWHRRPIPPRCH